MYMDGEQRLVEILETIAGQDHPVKGIHRDVQDKQWIPSRGTADFLYPSIVYSRDEIDWVISFGSVQPDNEAFVLSLRDPDSSRVEEVFKNNLVPILGNFTGVEGGRSAWSPELDLYVIELTVEL